MTDTLLLMLRCFTACSSMVMILSPSLATYQIYKTRNTGLTSVLPLVMMLANCHTWMIYGLVIHNIFPVFVTFGSGVVFALVYIAIFYRYTTERAYVRRVVGGVVAFLTLATLYAALGSAGVLHQSHETVRGVIECTCICVTVLLYGSPLEKIIQVLTHRSAVFIPISMVVAGTTNSALWVAYMAALHNWIMLVPEVICTALGLTSLVLYVVFHPSRCPYPKVDTTVSGDGNSLTIVLTPREELHRSKFQLENPAFEAMRSPVAPLHVV